MTELNGIFEPGEYGYRNGMLPRSWHNEFMRDRDKSLRNHSGGQHIFNLYAGTGAGKTNAAGMAASDDLNLGKVRRVVVCAPTLAIVDNFIEKFHDNFGIDLIRFNARSHRNGVTSDKQGYGLTYPGVASRPKTHRRIATYEPTLVILDEVHHLGDSESWGDAAQLAFGAAPFVISMSGSPFRPRGIGRVSFANYVPTDRLDVLRYQADYEYTLGRAIVDGYCREPDFRFSDDGIVEIRRPGSDVPERVSFRQKVSDSDASRRLTAAVQYGSPTRRELLRTALAEIKAAGRKVIIFLGGDTTGKEFRGDDLPNTPTGDALHLLPYELEKLGYSPTEYMPVTMKDKVHEKVKRFCESKTAWILGAVNTVSEGVDPAVVSAAIFLTTWVSPLSFIQRIGRALRFMGVGDHPDAWFYLFYHPDYLAAAEGIKDQMRAEAAIKAKRLRESGGKGDGPCERTEAVAISGGKITLAVWNGVQYPEPVFQRALQYIQTNGISKAFLTEVLDQTLKGQNGVHAGEPHQFV